MCMFFSEQSDIYLAYVENNAVFKTTLDGTTAAHMFDLTEEAAPVKGMP